MSGVAIETLSWDITTPIYDNPGLVVVGMKEPCGRVATRGCGLQGRHHRPDTKAGRPVMLFACRNRRGEDRTSPKNLAEIYSASKRCQVLHYWSTLSSPITVSRESSASLAGAYRGHDQVGRLIQKPKCPDPYGVLLLDEIEKTHPDVPETHS